MTAAPETSRQRRTRRALLWAMLVGLLLVAQTLLVMLTLSYESTRVQDETDAAAGAAASEIRRDLMRTLQSLQGLSWSALPPPGADAAQALMREQRELLRIEWRDSARHIVAAVDTPLSPPLFAQLPRRSLEIDADLACNVARRSAAPAFSRSYFVPMGGGQGQEVMDLCIPLKSGGQEAGFLVATVALVPLLEGALPQRQASRHELSFIEGDGTRLARAGGGRGAGVYKAERLVDLPGTTLQLRADAAAGRPSLIPNLATALVLGLSIALFAVVLLLLRDVRRRARAESALAQALAFRKAMEDSLVTGLRARDLEGRITYVNPAFCAMVGFSAEELQQREPPYWPPEHAQEYAERQRLRQLGDAVPRPGARDARDARESREGFETVFRRKNGDRFPVMIYEAPLVDGSGRHAGWMSAVLDVSAQRRIEELSRQQQDRLQATARLATVGEMASLLSHELNQPLAAIASYASGTLNMLDDPEPPPPALLRQGLERIAEQAERAGRIIKSVHHFVRRREQQRERLGADQLIDAVLPLVALQARKSGTRVEVDVPRPPARTPQVLCDRTMLEQVLLNLTRNGIQAMETATPLEQRVLTIRVRQTHARWISFTITDAGPGIAPEVAAQLFTPFYTTRSEGMGLGLSLCRTVVEQHGGALDFGPGPHGRGTEFRFTLPAPQRPETSDTAGLTAANT